MLSGIHSPNAAFTPDDYRTARLMGARSCKLLATAGTQHEIADLITLRSYGVTDCTVRLRDTREPDGRYPSADEYVASVLGTLRTFYSYGVRRFGIDNEPNQPGMWDTRGFGPWQYQYFMRHVVHLLRETVPPDVVLVSPPLSFAPALWSLGGENTTPYILDDWLAAFHWTDGGRLPNLWRIFDEVGANVYWQSLRQMADPSYGAAYDQLHARSGGMTVCVLEYASSASRVYNPDGSPRWTLSAANEMRRAQYPEWLREAALSGYVSRAYLYISPGATSDWADFRITSGIAEAVGEIDPNTGGLVLGAGRGIV